MLKLYIYSALLSFCSSLLISSISNDMILVNNQIFLYGVIALLIGSILFVLRTGFFRPFIAGCKQLYAIAFKQSAVMKNADEHISRDPSFQTWKNQFSAKFMQFTLGIGTGCIVCSIAVINI
ncbi:DUF3899 domain-containing protein [Cytobacillus praedii]|uniref:DUF3899 domain-containing protein n=1 Tax=Cytobacillus praedii TaxID=1742358 RepID=UPI002E21730D|nr:DUF3899 domain-containing protein [Cytobacillus praedii]